MCRSSQLIEDNTIIQGPVSAAQPYAEQHVQIYNRRLILRLREGGPNIANRPSVIVVCVLARTCG